MIYSEKCQSIIAYHIEVKKHFETLKTIWNSRNSNKKNKNHILHLDY